jgi:hypothetical protein
VRSSKFKGRRYRLSSAIEAYLRYQRDYVKRQSSNGDSAYNDARARRMNAVAIVEESKARQVSGELIERAPATAAIVNVVSIVKNHVLSIPTRCSRLLASQTDPVKVHSTLKQYCTLALREIADFSLEKCGEESRNGERESDDS